MGPGKQRDAVRPSAKGARALAIMATAQVFTPYYSVLILPLRYHHWYVPTNWTGRNQQRLELGPVHSTPTLFCHARGPKEGTHTNGGTT